MNTKPTNESDPVLSAVLREWKLSDSWPPRFQEQVWKRIERAEIPSVSSGSPWSLLTDWINAMLPRPALALACAMILLLIGGAAGWAQARHETGHVGDQLEARYLRVVDPYQPTD